MSKFRFDAKGRKLTRFERELARDLQKRYGGDYDPDTDTYKVDQVAQAQAVREALRRGEQPTTNLYERVKHLVKSK